MNHCQRHPQTERPCLQCGDHFCGYSNCFRMAVRKRGFLWICPVHARRPKKSSETASVFVKTEAEE